MYLEHLLDGTVDVIFTRRFRVEHLHWERSSWNGESWSIAVELGELAHRSELNTEDGMEQLTLSAFMVADVTISLRSRRRERTCVRVSRVTWNY